MTIRMLGLALLTAMSSVICSYGAVDKGLLALVPQNSQFVAGINVVASRNSDLGQYFSTRFGGDMRGLEQLTVETGFDPRRDLESIVFAGIPPTAEGSPRGGKGIVLARGTFDQNKIRSAALAKGAVVQSFSGVDVYTTADGHHQNAFTFLGKNVFAAGSVAQLQQAAINQSSPATLNAQLQQLITQVGTDNDLWFATIAPASPFPIAFGPGMNQSVGGSQTLQAISAANGGIRFGSAVDITIDAIARSEKDATALADVLRFGASLFQARGQSDAQSTALASALSQMLVTVSGPNVHLTLSLPEATIEQLAEMSPQHRPLAH